MTQRGSPFATGISSPPLGLSSDEDIPGSGSPEGVQQFERMFEDAVNVREELEDALSEFMLMGDKAKLTLEEELARMEEQRGDPEEVEEADETEELREQLVAARRIVETVKGEKQQTEARLEQVLDDAEKLRVEADDARAERESLEDELASFTASSEAAGAAGDLQRLRAQLGPSRGEGSQQQGAEISASVDHPGDLFVEQILWPKFQDMSAMVTSIQAFLAGQGQYVGRVDAETGEVQRVPRIQKRVKVARDGDREGELGRVMDDAEDMRVDLENALNEFLGSGSIDALQRAEAMSSEDEYVVFDLDAELENEDEALIAWGAQKWLHHVVGAGFRTW